MQDEINEKTIALYIKTGKLTAQTLQSTNLRRVIYALSDFLIMILSWLVKQSLRVFLFQEVQL